MDHMAIRSLANRTGCSVIAASNALKACNGDADLAMYYIRLKSEPLVRQKLVKGRWVNWSERDYINEAKRQMNAFGYR